MTARFATEVFNQIEKIGSATIYALADAGYTTGYAEYHSKIIKEKSELRQLIYLAEHIIDDAEQAIKPVSDIVAYSQTSLASFQHSSYVQKSLDFVDSFANLFQPEIEKNKAFANRSTGFDNLDNLQIFLPGFTSLVLLLPQAKLLSVGNFLNNSLITAKHAFSVLTK